MAVDVNAELLAELADDAGRLRRVDHRPGR